MKKGGYREAGMLAMGGQSRGSGFTIVEVMIVLAVSSAMFVMAALLISGRQNRTQFTTSINNLQQQLQQIINETASGYYPNSSNFTCSAAVSSTGPVTFAQGSNKQGTNGGCIFLGKALQFGLGSGASASQLGVLPLVGNQYQSGTATSVLTVGQSRPRAAYPVTTESLIPPATVGVPDASSISLMENSLTVAASNGFCVAHGVNASGICYVDNSSGMAKAAGMVAFVAGDSSGNITSTDTGGNLLAGSQQLSLYGVSGSTRNETLAAASAAIGGITPPTYATGLFAASSASICIANPSTNQSGLFTIDAGLHVTLKIDPGLTC